MGVIEDIQTRVGALENRMDEHDDVHVRIDRQLGRLTADVAELKTDVSVLKTDVSVLKTDVSELKADMAQVKANTADLGEIRAKVAIIPELQAGQIEMREMLAKLLTWAETWRGRS